MVRDASSPPHSGRCRKTYSSWPSLPELARRLARREVSAADLLEQSLTAIRAGDRDLRAFLMVAEEQARAQAQAVDRRRAVSGGRSLPFWAGIPYAVKDIICAAGLPTTAGSRILRGFVPPYDATVVERLRAAGAVLVGKTNLDEFAFGSSTEFSAFGATRNPWDRERVPGGSSGGSAAAVASGMVPFALGTDTGGSVRQPASFCGLVGLYPTYGRISRYGVIAFASSFDQVAPLARTVEDLAFVFSALAGPDRRDGTTLRDRLPDAPSLLRGGVKGLRIGLAKELWPAGVDPRVRHTVRRAVSALEDAGALARAVSWPGADAALAVYYILAPAEASTNLARYDSVRFGARPDFPASSYRELVREARGRGLGAEVKRRIILGTFVLSRGYAEQYYRRAAAARRALARALGEVFKEVDLLASPAAPELPFRLGEKTDDPLRMYLSDALTVPVNVAGVPALVVPAGTVEGLPVGMQLIAPPRREDLLFRAGAAYEQIRGDWRRAT